MMRSFSGRCILILVIFFATFSTSTALELLLGTNRSGTFEYHTGRTLCRLLNKFATDLQCTVNPADTTGHANAAVHTLTNTRGGALDLGLVDSTSQANAIERSGQFKFLDIDYGNLRSLLSLNNIPFTLITHQGAKIASLEDLKGKIVNIGNQGSPQREIMNALMAAKKWSKKTFRLAEQLPASQSQDSIALCHRKVDAIARVVIHPDALIRQMVKLCNAKLVAVSGPDIAAFTRYNPSYLTMALPARTYSSNPEPVTTFGVKMTLVTSQEMDEESVYTIVKTLFENLQRLKRSHPSFAAMTPTQMHSVGLTAPLHRGALKYYRERGWLE